MKGRISEVSNSKVGLPRIGKVKIGMKNKNGYPQSVDYFIPTGKYAGLFTQVYGDKPQVIQVVFPSDNPVDVCCEQYEYRDDAGQRIAYGDGEDFQVWNGNKYIEMNTLDYPNLMDSVAKRYPNKSVREGGEGWKIILTLNFIIPLVRGIAGLWTFETKGTASTIPNVRDTFDLMLKERGLCRGIVFDLAVQFAKSQKPGDKSKFPVVSLIPNESEENIMKIKEALKPVKLLNDGK